ncbi:hypothetical protein M885DRAFT_135232 [Pelagophyceae sp. CCMP2097]|nr:hypothetical protein M885DRAFT_135232 [Pelagophyceae sp. CCMP2097]
MPSLRGNGAEVSATNDATGLSGRGPTLQTTSRRRTSRPANVRPRALALPRPARTRRPGRSLRGRFRPGRLASERGPNHLQRKRQTQRFKQKATASTPLVLECVRRRRRGVRKGRCGVRLLRTSASPARPRPRRRPPSRRLQRRPPRSQPCPPPAAAR